MPVVVQVPSCSAVGFTTGVLAGLPQAARVVVVLAVRVELCCVDRPTAAWLRAVVPPTRYPPAGLQDWGRACIPSVSSM